MTNIEYDIKSFSDLIIYVLKNERSLKLLETRQCKILTRTIARNFLIPFFLPENLKGDKLNVLHYAFFPSSVVEKLFALKKLDVIIILIHHETVKNRFYLEICIKLYIN